MKVPSSCLNIWDPRYHSILNGYNFIFLLELMMEEVYKQKFMDTYVFIKSKKELDNKGEDGWMQSNK